MILLGIDPGVKKCGWAIILSPQSLIDYGTIITNAKLHGLDRQLYLLTRLQDLIVKYQPSIIAYEEFTWRSGDNESDKYVLGRPDMERLIGGIQGLALQPPFPVINGLLPQKWGKQLVGTPSHTKFQVAFCVNTRIGTRFKGDYYDNHACDAVGIALVAHDLLTMQEYQQHHTL